MDRASDSGSEGWGFESLPVYQIRKRIPIWVSSFLFRPPGGKGLEHSNATVRGTVAHARLDGHDTSVFAHSRAKTQTSPFRRTQKCGYPLGYPHFVI